MNFSHSIARTQSLSWRWKDWGQVFYQVLQIRSFSEMSPNNSLHAGVHFFPYGLKDWEQFITILTSQHWIPDEANIPRVPLLLQVYKRSWCRVMWSINIPTSDWRLIVHRRAKTLRKRCKYAMMIREILLHGGLGSNTKLTTAPQPPCFDYTGKKPKVVQILPRSPSKRSKMGMLALQYSGIHSTLNRDKNPMEHSSVLSINDVSKWLYWW